MRHPIKTRSLSILLLCMTLGLTNCGGRSADTTFYVLNPLTPSYVNSATTKAPKQSVGLGPISTPEYLNTPQIVIRKGDNNVKFAEFNRWAEPLTDNIVSVTTENLKTQLPKVAFVDYPWGGKVDVNYQVIVDILRFDADDDRNVEFHVQWSIVERKPFKETVILKRAKRYTDQLDGPLYYSKMVTLLNTMLNDWSGLLAEDIANVIRAADYSAAPK